jgi:hypothetical protein
MAEIANKLYIYFKIATILQIISKLQSTPLTKTSAAHHFTELCKSLIFKLRAFWEGSYTYMVDWFGCNLLTINDLICVFHFFYLPLPQALAHRER